MVESSISRINVSQFLNQYVTLSTRKFYIRGLRRFFELIYPEDTKQLSKKDIKLKIRILDALSERYLGEDRDHREDLIAFRDSLANKGLMTKWKRLLAIRRFLEENGISRLNVRMHAYTHDEVPNNEDLKRICLYMPLRGQVMMLVLASSGMRISELVSLKIEDVELNRNPVRVKLSSSFTGRNWITFISKEAKELVEEWLTYRTRYFEKVDKRKGKMARKLRGKDDGRLFPFQKTNVAAMFNKAVDEAGLAKVDERTGQVMMKMHCLRHFFKIRVARFGRAEAESMMGHSFQKFDESRLEEVYLKAIDDLSLYGKRAQKPDN